jgi:homoserine trans-succinylase
MQLLNYWKALSITLFFWAWNDILSIMFVCYSENMSPSLYTCYRYNKTYKTKLHFATVRFNLMDLSSVLILDSIG